MTRTAGPFCRAGIARWTSLRIPMRTELHPISVLSFACVFPSCPHRAPEPGRSRFLSECWPSSRVQPDVPDLPVCLGFVCIPTADFQVPSAQQDRRSSSITRPTWAGPVTVRPLEGHQLSIPSQKGVGADRVSSPDTLHQGCFCFSGQSPAFGVAEAMRRPPRRSLSTRFSSWRCSMTSR